MAPAEAGSYLLMTVGAGGDKQPQLEAVVHQRLSLGTTLAPHLRPVSRDNQVAPSEAAEQA